jgi:predicted tellurium resistance membrane protein TerC
MPIFIFFVLVFLTPIAPPFIHECLLLGFIAFIILLFIGLPLFLYDVHLKKYKGLLKYIGLTVTCKYYYIFILKLFFNFIKKKIRKVGL